MIENSISMWVTAPWASQVNLEDVNPEDVAMDLTELLALEPDALEGEGYFQYQIKAAKNQRL